jgi:Endonuclease NucS C-terminal domain
MIYDRPIWALMKDAAAELSPPYTVGEIVAWFAQHYPKIKASSVRAHIKGMTANDPSRHHYRVSGMTALFVRQPDKTLIPYDPAADTDADDDEEIDESPGADEDVTSEQSAEFVLEAHLEEFLVGNWKSIRWGRPLEIWTGPDGQPGHQLVTPIGRLDFLCTDPQTGALVVVELKRGRPSDKVVGQVARYMGYVRTHLAKPGQSVEGLIVAHEAEEALRYAVAAFPGLQLTTYEVTFQLSTVEEPTGF